MKLAELRQALQAADPAVVLVPARILERVIQQDRDLPTLLWQVPHRHCYVVDRHVLFRHIEQDELDLEADRRLPPTVILIARPPLEDLAQQERDTALLEYWRRLFHANVHLALEKLLADGKLSAEDIGRRVEQIGQAEFAEVRMVLDQDRYLLPPADETTAYIEFAAVYLELRYFAANLLPVYFPAIGDFERINRLLAADLDADALFAQTRLAGAPDPVVRTDTSSDESHDYYWRLVRGADRGTRTGNTVRSAILRTRAARVAPAALTHSTKVAAEADMHRLTLRLQASLQLTDAEAAEWLKDLPALLDKADQGSRPGEAALLYTLQRLCLDHERDIYTLDVVEWLLSAGKRPIKRPLPSQRLVRIIKHLRAAAQRLTLARVSDAARQHLAKLLHVALQRSEEKLRARFRPVLTDALQDVGLQPHNPPERTAFLKMVEEMLDRIAEYGFLTFSDLRDILSRNQLKLPDLAEPQQFIRGDPLIRLDRRLATLLDGVYRPGEFYLRWLERFTALNFGTAPGRLLMRFVTLPLGGAFVILEATELLLDKLHVPPVPRIVHYPLLVLLAVFLLGLLHVDTFRRRFVHLNVQTWRLRSRTVFLEWPARLVRIEALQRFFTGWPFQLLFWYVLKPLLVCALLALIWPGLFLGNYDPEHPLNPAKRWLWAGSLFLLVNLVLNSRAGRAANDAVLHAAVSLYDLLRSGLLPGLFRLIVRLFKEITDAVQYVLFTVDEWLRFRGGDSRWSMIVRTVLGVLWFPVSFLARFYMVVLVEPGINPIKFPVSSVAAKFVYPFCISIGATSLLADPLTPLLGAILANVFAATTVYLSPDAFGFLFWEMKENWSLYRANRRPTLRPVVFGPHGETVRRLLQPGFHSGTVPKLYTRLRRAEREAIQTNNWRGARACRHTLQQVERALQRLVAREFVTLLQQSASWQGQHLSVGRVALASNRIGIEVIHGDHPTTPVWLEWENQAGWLVAGVRHAGWLDQMTADQQRAAMIALAGLYKFAGIDLVREQVSANLPSGAARYDLLPRGLLVRPDGPHGPTALYDLRDPNGQLKPRTLDGQPAPSWPPLDTHRLMFNLMPVYWERWVECWQQDQNGLGPMKLFSDGVKLLPGE